MVIVEFFGQSPIDNMVSTLANHPDTVVFVGELKKMKKYDPVFRRFLRATGNSASTLEYWGIRARELHEIVGTLEQIVQKYPGCHFDITGGNPMTLTAVGIICERYREQGIELHQYNIGTGKVYDCDLNGKSVEGSLPCLTVEQNIILHGGSVVDATQRECGTRGWDFDEEFLEDLEQMWQLCRRNTTLWNRQITMIGDMERFNEETDPLAIRIRTAELESYLSRRRIPMDLRKVFDQLEAAGLLLDISRENGIFSMRFKNEQIRRVLSRAGTILELITCLAARETRFKDGTRCYQDAMTGVFIDWDGVVHELTDEVVDTENEIDVILMSGLIPVFVSCKNGAVGEEELYKLNTVAERFGGAYVKKALVGTTLGRNGRSKQYFLERARDMGIHVLEDAHKMSREELSAWFRQLIG